MSVTAAVVLAVLVAAGASVFVDSPPRPNAPLLAIAPQKQAPQPPATAPAAVRSIAPAPPRPDGATPAKDQGPLVIQAVVVDSQGRGLAGVDVNAMISYPRPLDRSERIIERAVSDHDGRIRMQVARERVEGRLSGVVFWAYQPGLAIARASVSLQDTASPPAIRLTLAGPVERTITVFDADNRPIEGLRVAPRSIRQGTSRFATEIPDELLERLTVTTDATGAAVLPYLSPAMEPLTVRIAGPGIAAHVLAVSDRPRKGTLKLERTGRLVGIVRGESGQPLADIAVAVHARASAILMPGMRELNNSPETIRFDAPPLTTGRQGVFQTPSTLLNGSTYPCRSGRTGTHRLYRSG